MFLSKHSILYLAIFLEFLLLVRSQTVNDETNVTSHSPAKKYHKKLRKEEGAIRLVGGQNDYEGNTILFYAILIICTCISFLCFVDNEMAEMDSV